MFCPHCGCENFDGMKYCVECGALLPDISQAKAGGTREGASAASAGAGASGGAGAFGANGSGANGAPGAGAQRRVVDLGATRAAAPGTYPDFDTEGPDALGYARPVAYTPSNEDNPYLQDSNAQPSRGIQGAQSPVPAQEGRSSRSSQSSRYSNSESRKALLASEDRPKSLALPILTGIVLGLAAILAFILVSNSCSREPGRVVDPEPVTTQEQPQTEEQPETEPVTEVQAGPTPKASLEDYTWDELAQIGQLIGESATESEALEVAARFNLVSNGGNITSATKTVTLSDGTEVRVRIADIYHDTAAENMHRTGITFIATTAPITHRMQPTDTNSGGWASSEMRNWLNSPSGLFGMLPADLARNIVPAAKQTNNTGHATSLDCVTATSDVLWIPSVVEVAGPVNWTWSSDADNSGTYNAIMNAEGSQYRIFRDAGIAVEAGNGALVVYGVDGSALRWWLRSCSVSVNNHFRLVGADGDPSLFDDATLPLGVVFGFCM